MKELKYAILIFIAIWAWQVALVCLGIWLIFLFIRAIFRAGKNNTKQAKIQAVAPHLRDSLSQDRRKLLSIITDVIRKHWDTLEDKFEQCVDEDDYGNKYTSDRLRKEFVYFSGKVVLPELESYMHDKEAANKSIALVLADTAFIFENLSNNYYGIEFIDSSSVIAEKLLRHVADNTHMDNELLYTLHTNPEYQATYEAQIERVFMTEPSITLNFKEDLQSSESMRVAPFVALVFTIFSALHNAKKHTAPKTERAFENFIGNDPYKYEEYIKKLLRNEGYDAKRTRGSGDYGIDVVATKNGKIFAIQCKLYNHSVGFKAVQEVVSGRIYYKADFAVVVSDNSFTDAARNMARRSNVLLAHHKNLIRRLDSVLERESKKPAGPTEESEELAHMPKKQWTTQDTDELIAVVLPTINNDK